MFDKTQEELIEEFLSKSKDKGVDISDEARKSQVADVLCLVELGTDRVSVENGEFARYVAGLSEIDLKFDNSAMKATGLLHKEVDACNHQNAKFVCSNEGELISMLDSIDTFFGSEICEVQEYFKAKFGRNPYNQDELVHNIKKASGHHHDKSDDLKAIYRKKAEQELKSTLDHFGDYQAVYNKFMEDNSQNNIQAFKKLATTFNPTIREIVDKA